MSEFPALSYKLKASHTGERTTRSGKNKKLQCLLVLISMGGEPRGWTLLKENTTIVSIFQLVWTQLRNCFTSTPELGVAYIVRAKERGALAQPNRDKACTIVPILKCPPHSWQSPRLPFQDGGGGTNYSPCFIPLATHPFVGALARKIDATSSS